MPPTASSRMRQSKQCRARSSPLPLYDPHTVPPCAGTMVRGRRQASRWATKPTPRANGSAEPSRKPFLESPADFVTRAPNFLKLGQAGRARQDLVRKSESTTKCGDCGDESSGE